MGGAQESCLMQDPLKSLDTIENLQLQNATAIARRFPWSYSSPNPTKRSQRTQHL